MKYVFIDSFEGETQEYNFAGSVPIFPSPLLIFVFVSSLLMANMLLSVGDSSDWELVSWSDHVMISVSRLMDYRVRVLYSVGKETTESLIC